MTHDLTDAEIDELLNDRIYGHLGCTLPDGRIYVVPVTYAYSDGTVYGFSFPGQKIKALRLNPSVCFQTERMMTDGIWESVIAWGAFEELKHAERVQAMNIIFSRLEHESGITLSPLFRKPDNENRDSFVFYRIRLAERTGRRVESDY